MSHTEQAVMLASNNVSAPALPALQALADQHYIATAADTKLLQHAKWLSAHNASYTKTMHYICRDFCHHCVCLSAALQTLLPCTAPQTDLSSWPWKRVASPFAFQAQTTPSKLPVSSSPDGSGVGLIAVIATCTVPQYNHMQERAVSKRCLACH
jgi:hypothetical protein